MSLERTSSWCLLGFLVVTDVLVSSARQRSHAECEVTRPASHSGALSCRTIESGRTRRGEGAGDTMTTEFRPEDGRPDPALSVIIGERRQLINLAYRLLGSLAEAEDAVQ